MADPRAEIRELLVEPPQWTDDQRPADGTLEAEAADVIREQAADDLLDAYRDAVLHAAAERQRAAIREFDLDDHWAVFYRVEDVEKLPDLIDPHKQEQP